MTLDYKSRPVYPSTQTPTKQPFKTRPQNTYQQSIDIDRLSYTPMARRGKMRDSSGESFLQRLLEIERRHDEKRMFHQKAIAKKSDNNVVKDSAVTTQDQDSTTFQRSPTRWISEQILDDTQDSNNFANGDQESFENTKSPSFYASAQYCRLPTLADVQRMSSISRCTTNSSSSTLITPNNQTESDSYHVNSLSSISYVELQQDDDFQTRPPPPVRKRPLRLAPILLPPIYTVPPRPLKERDFLTPTCIRGPITDEEWEGLRQCRYIRPAPPGRFYIPLSASQMSLL